jgi:hypothetical protein
VGTGEFNCEKTGFPPIYLLLFLAVVLHLMMEYCFCYLTINPLWIYDVLVCTHIKLDFSGA